MQTIRPAVLGHVLQILVIFVSLVAQHIHGDALFCRGDDPEADRDAIEHGLSVRLVAGFHPGLSSPSRRVVPDVFAEHGVMVATARDGVAEVDSPSVCCFISEVKPTCFGLLRLVAVLVIYLQLAGVRSHLTQAGTFDGG